MILTNKEEKQIPEPEFDDRFIDLQLERFRRGFEKPVLSKSASVGNGIVKLTEERKETLINRFDDFSGSVAKFVPASGAATRMFRDLFPYLEENEKAKNPPSVLTFFDGLEKFAFYPELEEAFSELHSYPLKQAISDKKFSEILSVLLRLPGLGYGNLPKGLLAFHAYNEGSRTAAFEQLAEASDLSPGSGDIHVHFTIAEYHQDIFSRRLEEEKGEHCCNVQISYSVQDPSTNSLAVDSSGLPFKDDEGNFVFRPSGHGALLQNLSQLKQEVVFIKNIDNILPDKLKAESVKYKKVLAGLLLEYQEKTFELLRRNDLNEDISEEARSLLREMGVTEINDRHEQVEKLNRPIRVCGMVRNEGEPGGGPFWIEETGKKMSLQIIEAAQVDNSPSQQSILKSSTHFNPVDLVCGVYDYRGEKFDLVKYRDETAGFISEKFYQGRPLKAMELPGLWNGSMADWNTIFVEIPLATFSPVKTINDLLKEEHQA